MQRNLKLVALELTTKCKMNCPHCRMDRLGELDFKYIESIFKSIKKYGRVIIILSGGDPLLYSRLEDVIKLGSDYGHIVTLSTSDGELLSEEKIKTIKNAGLKMVALSTHADISVIHDKFVANHGAFESLMCAIKKLKKIGLPFQINTTIHKENKDRINQMFAWVKSLGASAWHLFFLVPTGKALSMDNGSYLSALEHEKVLHKIAKIDVKNDLKIKVTCAPQYNRIIRYYDRNCKLSRGCMAANGFLFVSVDGDVKPCGYFSYVIGSIKKRDITDIYENSDFVKRIVKTENLKGKCKNCDYNQICFGCRARAYGIYKDALMEDAFCLYNNEAKMPTLLAMEEKNGR